MSPVFSPVAREHLVQDRHEHLDLGELVGAAPVVGLREGDDRDVACVRVTDELLVRVVVRVRLAGGPVVVGVAAAFGPHGFDAQAHADLVVGDAADPAVQGEVGAVEGDVGVDVRDFDVEVPGLDVDDAVRGDRAAPGRPRPGRWWRRRRWGRRRAGGTYTLRQDGQRSPTVRRSARALM